MPEAIPVSRTPSLSVGFAGTLLAVAEGPGFTLWRATPSCERGGRLLAGCRLGRSGVVGDGVNWLAFDHTGSLIATGAFNGEVELWRVSNPREPRLAKVLVKEPDSINALAFSPQEELLAVGGKNGTIELWDVRNPDAPARVTTIPAAHGGQPVDALAFSPDGRLLASGGEDQQVIFWRVQATEGLKEITNSSQSNSILAVAFSPDGRTLAAGDGDGSTCLYDVRTLQSLGSPDCLLGHGAGTINATRFTPDSRWLLSAGRGNPVVGWSSILWSNSGRALKAAVCSFRLPALTPSQWSSAFYGTSLAHRSPRATCGG